MSPSRMVDPPFVLPEVCDVAKVFRYPFVAIDGLKVAFSAVRKNRHARRALRYPLLHLFYCHEHCPRRAAGENAFALHQTATADHTIQVCHPQTLLSQAGAVKLRAPGRAVSGNEPLRRLCAENRAAHGIDREDM